MGSLRLRKDVALTPLAKDSVRVDVKCVGLNFADVFTVLGLYGAAPKNETVTTPVASRHACRSVVIGRAPGGVRRATRRHAVMGHASLRVEDGHSRWAPRSDPPSV